MSSQTLRLNTATAFGIIIEDNFVAFVIIMEVEYD